MKCKVFRSDKKAETYLYLSESTAFEDLPDALRGMFGEPALVMNLEISAETRLARVEAAKVMRGLADDGYFLQLPPKIPTEEEISRWLR